MNQSQYLAHNKNYTKMKNLKNIILLSFFTLIVCCKAQLPLNTGLLNIPPNSYVKDLNNELNPYEGTYKANFQGNEISLYIIKEENRLVDRINKKFYRDALNVKYIVKNSSGSILQDTKNNTSSQIELYSIGIRSVDNSVILSYTGTNCGVGWGKVLVKKINANQLSWDYQPNDIIIDSNRCPAGTDINIYLPETKDLIFTKQ